ncbi:hypothetical protein TorRG33x02_034800, partial [Trema orientale]
MVGLSKISGTILILIFIPIVNVLGSDPEFMAIGSLIGWSKSMQPNKDGSRFMPSSNLKDYEASIDLSSVWGSAIELLESERGKKKKKGGK